MKTKLNVYERIEKFLKKAKIPTAYALFIYITTVQYIPVAWMPKEFKEISLLPVAITLGIIIMRVFFDIYKKIYEPSKTLPYFKDWKQLSESNELLTAFDKRLKDDKVIHIKAIGVSLRNYWASIKTLIAEYVKDDKNFEFVITLAILDPEFYDSAEFVDDNFKGKFEGIINGVLSEIQYFQHEASEKQKCKCIINVYKYRFVPPFYGISFDDKFLFMGNTFWEEGKFRSSGQSHNLYVEDDEFSGTERIQMFNSWFEYIKK